MRLRIDICFKQYPFRKKDLSTYILVDRDLCIKISLFLSDVWQIFCMWYIQIFCNRFISSCYRMNIAGYFRNKNQQTWNVALNCFHWYAVEEPLQLNTNSNILIILEFSLRKCIENKLIALPTKSNGFYHKIFMFRVCMRFIILQFRLNLSSYFSWSEIEGFVERGLWIFHISINIWKFTNHFQ